MRGRGLAIFAVCVLVCSIHPAVGATVQYNYVGNRFDLQSGGPPPPSSVINLSGNFIVNQSLLLSVPFSFDDITSAITAFSFTDGFQTVSNSSTSVFSFTISLDSSGALTGPWLLELGDTVTGPGFLSFSYPTGACGDTTRGAYGYFATIQCSTGVDTAGTWSGSFVVGSPSPVSEPPSLVLLTGALGLLGFGGSIAVRRRIARPANLP